MLERVGAAVHEAEVGRALEIVQDMLCGGEVHRARVAQILAELLDGVRDVQARAKYGVHERTHDCLVERSSTGVLGSVVVYEMDVRIERRVNGVCECHAEALKNVCNILCLPQCECAMCAVAVDFESDNLADVAEFGQLKMSFKIVCESVGVSGQGRERCHVVYMDSNKCKVVGGSVAVHALVREEACEAKGRKRGVELEVPLPSQLLEPVERAVQAAGSGLPIFVHGWLPHVYLFLQLPVEVHADDVDDADVEVEGQGGCAVPRAVQRA